jgi:hypothetical protein
MVRGFALLAFLLFALGFSGAANAAPGDTVGDQETVFLPGGIATQTESLAVGAHADSDGNVSGVATAEVTDNGNPVDGHSPDVFVAQENRFSTGCVPPPAGADTGGTGNFVVM